MQTRLTETEPLEKRIMALESRCRRDRATFCIVLVAMLGIAIAGQSRPSISKSIDASEVIVRDAEGRKRIRLGSVADSDVGFGLVFYDLAGELRSSFYQLCDEKCLGVLNVTGTDKYRATFMAGELVGCTATIMSAERGCNIGGNRTHFSVDLLESDTPRVGMGISDTGQTAMYLARRNQTEKATSQHTSKTGNVKEPDKTMAYFLTLNDSSEPVLRFFDSKGNGRLSIGAEQLSNPITGTTTTRGLGSIVLCGENGQTIWTAP